MKKFKTGWKKAQEGSYKTPTFTLELIDSKNKPYGFKLAILGRDDKQVRCSLDGFLKDEYEFVIPSGEALTDGIFDAGKIFKWVLDQLGKLLCPQCS